MNLIFCILIGICVFGNFIDLINSQTANNHTNLRRNLLMCNSAITPTLVDWTGIYTTSIKDAGYCLGSGWAFASIAQIESDTIRLYGSQYNYVLSTQQLIECVNNNDGCNSGNINYGLTYATVGIAYASSYPYTSYYGTIKSCQYNSGSGSGSGSGNIIPIVKLTGYFTQLTNNENCMGHYVQTTGPISVCVSVSSNWYSYTGGIMDLSKCPVISSLGITHCLQVVGVYPKATGGYWKLRNSFGTNWGENGYIRLSYGTNTCGITSNPIYTTTSINF
jgi:hypothetical protein